MRLDDDRYEEIKKEVIFLFEQYDIKCIPISGFEIASNMGIILFIELPPFFFRHYIIDVLAAQALRG